MRLGALLSRRVIFASGVCLVVAASCGGDVLTLGRAALEGPADSGPPEASVEAGPDTGADTGADAPPDNDVGDASYNPNPPVFEVPETVQDINRAGDGVETDNATLTDNQLQIFFTSRRDTDGGPESTNIWVATRSSIEEDFGAPVLVEGLNDDGAETSPTISGNGTKLWFGWRDGPETEDPGVDIYVSTRSSPTSNDWSPRAKLGDPNAAGPLQQLNSNADDIPRPTARVGALFVMPMGSRRGTVGYQNWIATSSDETTWTLPVYMEGVNVSAAGVENADGFLWNDGTEFFFSSNRDGVQDLYFVRARPEALSRDISQRFGAEDVRRLAVHDGAVATEIHKDPWLGRDESGQVWLYLTSNREDGREQIFRARMLTPPP